MIISNKNSYEFSSSIKKIFACGGHPSGRLLKRRAVSDGPLRGGLTASKIDVILQNTLPFWSILVSLFLKFTLKTKTFDLLTTGWCWTVFALGCCLFVSALLRALDRVYFCANYWPKHILGVCFYSCTFWSNFHLVWAKLVWWKFCAFFAVKKDTC